MTKQQMMPQVLFQDIRVSNYDCYSKYRLQWGENPELQLHYYREITYYRETAEIPPITGLK